MNADWQQNVVDGWSGGFRLILGLVVVFFALASVRAGDADAAKLCCSVFPPEPPSSEGTAGEQFVHIGGIAVNVSGNGPGVLPGDIYVIDSGNNRVQQLRETADGEGRRFVRAFGRDVGGAGVDVCTVAAACQAGAASADAGAMSEPVGVAIDQATGNLYVTDNVNHRVDVFRADGTFKGAFGWKVDSTVPLEELQFCTALSGCQAGSVGGGAGQFGERGGAQELNEIGEQRGIGHPAVAPIGAPDASDVLIADSANNRIDQFSVTLSSGEVTGAAFVKGIGWGVATGASSFQQCGPGADPTPTTTCQTGIAGGSLGQFTNRGLTRVAVDSTGAIYAVNRPHENAACNSSTRRCHVQKFDLAGTSPVEFAPALLERTTTNMNRVAASEIAVDPTSGNVYVARPNGLGASPEYQILRFDSTGGLIESYRPGTEGIGANQKTVFGLALNYADGNLYLTSTTGGQRVFLLTEPPAIAPTVVTAGVAPGANFSLEKLEGSVNPEGFRVLGCYFEYGKTTEYGTSVPCEPSEPGEGTGPVAIEGETEPLEPSSTYHYRLVAENGGPIGLGQDRTFTTGAAPPDSCPNAARRAEQGIAALVLPACMALEQVSPPQKGGQPARYPEVSADGSRVRFLAQAALGEDPPGLVGLFGSPYVASRGPGGWASESTVPANGMFHFWESEINLSFTPDLSRWLRIGGTSSQLQKGVGVAYEGGLGGIETPLSEPMVPFTFGTKASSVVERASFLGASADHSHLFFRPGGNGQPSYFPGDPTLTGTGVEEANVYVARRGADGQLALELLGRDRTGKVWGGNCGSRLGGIGGGNGLRNQGAISADGSLTYVSARASQPASGNCSSSNKLRILERTESSAGTQIAPLFSSECDRPPSEPCGGADGDDFYQGGSADQSKVYFTTNRQLADSDRDGSTAECESANAVAGCDLYLYDRSRPTGERLVQVSAGEELGLGVHERGEEAKVYNGVTAISGDGSRVYFVAQGVLTSHPNPAGASAQAGQPNLYLWDAGSEATSFVGTLSAFDFVSLWGEQGSWRNNAYPVPATGKNSEGREVGGDGHVLIFESDAELTSADADGEHRDVYRYDADNTGSLSCLSCRPGGPDSMPFDVEFHSQAGAGGTDFAEEGRWASEDGEAASFMTPEGLVPGDENGTNDFYVWWHGQLVRLPGKPYLVNSGPFFSHDGSTVAYATFGSLLPQDGDAAVDVYVARVDGGYPNPATPATCEPGNGCQQPAAAPTAPKPASEAQGAGNPKPTPQRCPKGKVRRKGRCVPRHAHKRHAKKRRHRSRHANADRRTAK